MTYEIVSVLCGGPGPMLPTGDSVQWHGRKDYVALQHFYKEIDNRDNRLSPCQAYQQALESSESDVLVYVHDDVTIHDPNWLQEVLCTFAHSTPAHDCVAVGLGGALMLGRPNLYKQPYNIWNLARGGYMSNQTDAEVHGARETGVRRVAVLDAFFMAVRRSFLLSVGGWPTAHLTHHCVDLWLACEAARAGKETWMVGADCTHWGGGSSVSPKYKAAAWLQGGSMEEDHRRPHLFLYNEYRDVLPIEVKS
jgi:hypothetical protein